MLLKDLIDLIIIGLFDYYYVKIDAAESGSGTTERSSLKGTKRFSIFSPIKPVLHSPIAISLLTEVFLFL